MISTSFGQEFKAHLTGDILDSAFVGINNCTVKITKGNGGIILAYFNTSNKNSFSSTLLVSANETIIIEVSHLAYQSTKKVGLAADLNKAKLSFVLQLRNKQLETVKISAPAKWVRGDTTFHKVSAYKEGDEKKLKDILLKMPDFTLDDNGKILYKRQSIDKITIDNEELFSDKTELLLNNLPVHILNTVQAIENQSSQKLLKGLNGERKVFLNLGLNKGVKLSTAFGDGEAGIGNGRRYNLTPVIFSMYGKAKVGFIGNYNSIGNGIGYQQDRELKNDQEIDASKLLMNSNTLQLVNNFENRWYIKNNQWDSRFQINTLINKKIKSSTEINYVKDNQKQNTFTNSAIYNGQYYQNRIDTNSNFNNPKIWLLRQSFEINPDSTRQLIFHANALIDRSQGQKYTIFRGFEINSPLQQITNNSWNSLNLSAFYTVRKTVNSANTFALSVNRQFLKQSATNISKDIGAIINNPNCYDAMILGLNSGYTLVKGNWSALRKSNSGNITNIGISSNYIQTSLSNYTTISSIGLPVIIPDSLNSKGKYTFSTLSLNLSRSERIFAERPLSIKTDIGMAKTTGQEQAGSYNFYNLIINSSLTQRFDLLKFFRAEINTSYSQSPVNTFQVAGNYYPNGSSSFIKFSNIGNGEKKFKWYSVVAWDWPGDLSNTSIMVISEHRLNNRLSINQYNYFVQLVTDSVVNNSTSSFTVRLGNQIPSLLINALINIDIQYSTSAVLQNINRSIISSNYRLTSVSLSLKKNWNKRYYLRASSQYAMNSLKIPSIIENNTTKQVSNVKTIIYNRFLINKQIYFILSGNLFNNNLFTPNRTSTLITDFEVNYSFKKKPVFISLRADNLTNDKYLNIFSNSVMSQTFTNIPLIGRTFYGSIRYNF
jgi:hypothetical protein